MKMARRIQLVAVAVIVNSTAALTLLSPNSAQAATCNPKYMCFPVSLCESNYASYCATLAPPGCTVATAQCYTEGTPCNSQQGQVYCTYHQS